MTSSEPLCVQDIETLSTKDVLHRLGLGQAADGVEAEARKAIARNDGPMTLFERLMRQELIHRIETRAARGLKRSGIFPVSTLDTYDWDFPERIDKEKVRKAADLEFLKNRTNVVFVGPSGVGKTHLGNALGVLAAARGYSVRFVTAADLVNDLVQKQARNTLSRAMIAWGAWDLLIIDELGYLRFDPRGSDLLYQVLNRRYMRASTIVTTNLPFKEWGKLFPDAAAASAIAERLVHNGILVRITGRSFRTVKPGGDADND